MGRSAETLLWHRKRASELLEPAKSEERRGMLWSVVKSYRPIEQKDGSIRIPCGGRVLTKKYPAGVEAELAALELNEHGGEFVYTVSMAF